MKVNIKKLRTLREYKYTQKLLVGVNGNLLYNIESSNSIIWRKQKAEYIKQLRTFEKEYMEHFV